jgi:transcriptional regulator with XRE-family HTH domain
MMMVASSLQNCLRAVRLKKGVSQEALARLAGLSEPTVARIDANPNVKISLRQGAALARALQCDILDLLP